MLTLAIFHSKLSSSFFSSKDKADEVRIAKTYIKISCIKGDQDYTQISPLRYTRRYLSWAISQKKWKEKPLLLPTLIDLSWPLEFHWFITYILKKLPF